MVNPNIYAIQEDGKLLWYHHPGPSAVSSHWEAPKEIGSKWHKFKKVFSAGLGIIYAIAENDDLLWYRHEGYQDGTNRWNGPKKVGNGWNFENVFCAANGDIYAIERSGFLITGETRNGHLLCYRHLGITDGSDQWAETKRFGSWNFSTNKVKQVFAGEEGIIYSIRENGDLFFHKNRDYQTGGSTWDTPKKVGNGWDFEQVFSNGEGVIYAVEHANVDWAGHRTGGHVQWYHHLGFLDGTDQWEGPKQQVGIYFGGNIKFKNVFSGGLIIPAEVGGSPRHCGVMDSDSDDINIQTYGSPGGRWPTGLLTYNVDATNSGLNQAAVDNVIAMAFRTWINACSYLSFLQVNGPADIQIRFGGQNLDNRFGNLGGIAASGGYPNSPLQGQLYFDSIENWSAGNSLLVIALHEIGHILGLSHSNNRNSVMYPYDMKLAVLDDETVRAIQSLYGWRTQRPISDKGSAEGPSLATAGQYSLGLSASLNLFMAWRGVDDDDNLYWSFLNGEEWSPQENIPGSGSAHGPALATGYTTNRPDGVPVIGLFMAWDGVPGDNAIYYSQNSNLSSWDNQHIIAGVGTSDRPALCMFNGKMRMAWKGIEGDNALYWASFDGIGWSSQQQIIGRGSSHGPTMTVLGNRLYMFWKGIGDDSKVYYSWVDNQPNAIWQPQHEVVYTESETGGNVNLNIGTSNRPFAITRANTIILAWKGVIDDSGIYFSYFENDEFSGQINISGVGSSSGPGFGVLNNKLYLVWKGIAGDTGLYFSWLG